MIPASQTVLLSILMVVVCNCGLSRAATWSYDESGPDGPSKWGNSYETCKKSRQSPIGIQTKQSVFTEMPVFSFTKGYFEADKPQEIINNGHTIQINFNVDDKKIGGGGLPSTYRLVQLHLHWGSKDAIGSEHFIDDRSYPLEIHLVHFDDINYADVGGALTSGTGIAVLGVLAQVGTQGNKAFQAIVDFLGSVKYAGQNASFTKTFPVIDLLPYNHDNYFRYLGSLTTPPCHESVVWTVFQKPITVTSEQLAALRKVMHNKPGEAHDSPIADNFRPLQKLNNRTVKRSFCTKTDTKNSGGRLESFAVPILAILAISLKFF